MRLRRVSSADPCQRWKSLPESFAQEPQQMVAVGVYRGGLGGGWLFGLLRRSLPPASRSRQERQYCPNSPKRTDLTQEKKAITIQRLTSAFREVLTIDRSSCVHDFSAITKAANKMSAGPTGKMPIFRRPTA